MSEAETDCRENVAITHVHALKSEKAIDTGKYTAKLIRLEED